MFNNILEISKRANKGGRVPIKIALLKIHDDASETNLNGIHWDEEYVKRNIETTITMPICCEFADETKTTPLGHGLTGSSFDEDGIEHPEFLNSETVGVIESASIEIVDIEGVSTKVLLGNGCLFSQRYPGLVKWVRNNFALGKVSTSIETTGLETNDNKITYLEDKPTDIFRTPVDFVFSGTAILSVQPSDSNAIVIEVAQKNIKEEYKLTEQEIMQCVEKAIVETNSTKKDVETKISELNTQLVEKESTITELKASVKKLETALDELNKQHETYWAERDLLERELVKVKVATKLEELGSTIGEFNETEQEVVKEDIDKLKADINACEKKEELENFTSEINSIKSKICIAIIEKQKKSVADARISEQNALKENKTVDIFSEVTSAEDDENKEDLNIF